MLKLVTLVATMLFASHALATEIPLNNADFESAMRGTRIPGWARIQHAGVGAYLVERDSETFAHGKHSIRMHRTENQAYGLIMQQLQIPGLAGKQVEFSAALKTRNVGKLGWVMVITFKQHSNIIEQFRAEPMVGDTDWTEVVLSKTAPAGTTTVEIGFMLLDGGTGWADHVRLRTLDDSKSEDASADKQAVPAGKANPGKADSIKPAADTTTAGKAATKPKA